MPSFLNRRENIDPAEQAALLLFRLGFGIISIVLPVLAVFSRRALVIVAPIGALVMVAATLMMPGQPLGGDRMRRALSSPVGLAALFLVFWSAVSLLWTPNPEAAGERLFRVAGSAALAVAAIAALPPRMRTANLYLPAVGIAVAGMTVFVVTLLGQKAVDGTALERAAVLITLMAWPTVTWLSIKRRSIPAMAIAAGIGGMALVMQGPAVLPALLVGAVLLGGAINNLRGASSAFMGAAALLIMGGPLIALLLSLLAPQESGFGRTMQLWSDIIVADPGRLLTGHGLESALRNRIAQQLDPAAPKSLIFEVWYELGLLGASAATMLLVLSIASVSRMGRGIAPFALGCMGFAFALSVIGLGTSQTWWITALAATAIIFAAVSTADVRTERPVAFADTARQSPAS